MHKSKNKKIHIHSLPFFHTLTFIVVCLFASGCSRNVPSYWHPDGTIIKDITWEVPIADSSTVLITEGNLWKLPQPPDSIIPQITYTTYRTPQLLGYTKLLGRIDQEVVHGNDTSNIEFYRFENGAVLFLGFATPDTLQPLTMFDPPLIIVPAVLKDSGQSCTSTGTMKTWSRNKYDNGYKTSYTIIKKGTGRFIAEDGKERDGIFCENKISRNATIQYGQTNLIVPDAITLSNNSILSKEKGIVLEWGIRSRKVETSANIIPDRDRELYIEITLHRKQ